MKKLISMLLAFTILITTFSVAAPVYAYANDKDISIDTHPQTITNQTDLLPVDIVIEDSEENNMTESDEDVSLLAQDDAEQPTSGTCGENLTWTLDDEGTVTIRGTGEMHGYSYGPGPWGTSIKKVIIEEGVTTVGAAAFQRCAQLEYVKFPSTLKSIEGEFSWLATWAGTPYIASNPGAFDGCVSLKSLDFPYGLEKIGSAAFQGCTGLTEISIPDSVTELGERAFWGCMNLKNVKLSSALKRIPCQVFNGTAIESIVIPEGLEVISGGMKNYYGVFGGSPNLSSISIPDSVTEIEEGAFSGCAEDMVIYCVPGSYADEYAQKYGYTSKPWNSLRLFVNVADSNEKNINSGYTVRWYEKGSDSVLAIGSYLHNVDTSKEYEYQVVLNDPLCYQYAQPARQVISQKGETEQTYRLTPMTNITVSGKLTNADGKALAKGNIMFSQTFGGQYEKVISTTTDANGNFSAVIANVPTTIKCSADGYYSKAKKIIHDSIKEDHLDCGSFALTQLPENKITLTCKMVSATTYWDIATERMLTSAQNLRFEIFNKTQNKVITDFTVEYPYIILGESTSKANDTITISAFDTKNTMTAESTEIILDDKRIGSGEIVFVENGHFEITNLSGVENTVVMVFDQDGILVDSSSVQTIYIGKSMPAGTYTVVALEKTEMLRSVPSLAKLNELGLSSGVDYSLQTVEIQNGVITEIYSMYVPIFDETKFSYTVSEHTSFTANHSSVTIGKYVTYRLEYEIDRQCDSKNEVVSFEIPKGMTFSVGSMSLDGKSISYTEKDGMITVNVNQSKGVLRFYALPIETGEHLLNAYLSFTDNDSTERKQSLGTAKVKATDVTFETPSKTGQTKVLVKGTAIADSIVTIYDNGVKVATTTVNKVGVWRVLVELNKPYTYSVHEIYAEIESERYDGKIITETKHLTYDASYIEVSKVTMYTGGNACVFDFLEPGFPPSYGVSADADMPRSFTFMVEFTGGDDAVLENVYVVTTNDAGDKTFVPAIYDKETGLWLGSYVYEGISALPVSVGVVFDNIRQNGALFIIDEEMSIDAEKWINTLQNDLSEAEKSADIIVETIYDTISSATGLGSRKTKVSLWSQEEEKYIAAYSETQIDKIPENYTFDHAVKINLADGTSCYLEYSEINNAIVVTLCETKNDTKAVITLTLEETEAHKAKAARPIIDEWDSKVDKMGVLGVALGIATLGVGTTFGIVLGCAGLAVGVIGTYMSSYDAAVLEQKYNNYMKTSNPCLIDSEMRQFGDDINRLTGGGYLGNTLSILFGGLSAAVLSAGAKGFSSFMGGLSILAGIGSICSSWQMATIEEKMDNKAAQCGVTPSDFNEKQIGLKIHTPAWLLVDPSGYVYEAVPSNRVEGVKAEIWYYDYPLDKHGEPKNKKEEMLWNAAEYDQINPQYTDSEGRFQWDVTPGEWFVKFSKDGYYDTDSKNDPAANENGYLPVPPPQVEVNTAIVSKSAPEVSSVNAYTNEIQIIFSQYMNIDSVNTENIIVTCNGLPVNGEIVPVNAEYNYEQTVQYASIFTFMCTEAISGDVTIKVSNVKNYADTAIAAPYTVQKTILAKPTSITVAESISIEYASSTLAPIQVLPAEAGKELTLIVTSSSPYIADAVNKTVVTDENGMANIMLIGKLPGQCDITITIADTDLSTTITVAVGEVQSSENKCAKVKANIETNSIIKKGTTLILTTETEDANIYYTLDGTCPCMEDSPSRLLYTTPITLHEDTFLIAYAVKDGYKDSSTVGFVYTLEKVNAPTASVSSGEVTKGKKIKLSSDTEDAIIYYTTDGSDPTIDSMRYTGKIKITEDVTIKAIAVKDGMNNSDILTVSYAAVEVNWVAIFSGVAIVGILATGAIVFVIIKRKKAKENSKT